MAGFLVFLAVFLVVFGGTHYYLWRRLARDTTAPGSPWRRVGAAAAVLLPLWSMAALFATRVEAPMWAKRLAEWPGYLWLAVLLYLTLALLAAEPVRWWLLRRARTREVVGAVSAGAGRPPLATAEAPEPAQGPTRRQVVARGVGLTAGLVATGATAHGLVEGMRTPRIKDVAVPLARLGAGADGFRIAVVSDIHLSPMRGAAHCRRIVEAVNGTDPDLIAVVGDLVDGSVEELGRAAEPLADLESRFGAYFVTGNHEYYVDTESWIDEIQGLGLVPLQNERAEIDGFDLAGLNDLAAEQASGFPGPDFAAALGDRDPERAVVLMAHQPIVVHEAVDWGVDLQLSGHTHGGQMWPATYAAGLANPTLAGLERYGDTQLYVTRGAGTWGPPVRVGAPSDITVVTLRTT